MISSTTSITLDDTDESLDSGSHCPVCGGGITIARFESGTTLCFCEHGCYHRIQSWDGTVRQEACTPRKN